MAVPEQFSRSQQVRQSSPQQAMFLAADVGGTHARIGLVSQQPDGVRPVTVLQYHRYTCADWPSLTAVLKDFAGQLDRSVHADRCVVASAGYVLGDAIVNDNLPWPVSIRDIRDSLGIAQLAVINDFKRWPTPRSSWTRPTPRR
jgi:glucokinase